MSKHCFLVISASCMEEFSACSIPCSTTAVQGKGTLSVPSLISFFCNNFPILTGGDGMSVSHTVCASDLRDNLSRLS